MEIYSQIPNPNSPHAKVFLMEVLFLEAFANAFDLTLDEASGPMWEMMDQLDDSGFTERLANDFPDTSRDLERLEEYNTSRGPL